MQCYVCPIIADSMSICGAESGDLSSATCIAFYCSQNNKSVPPCHVIEGLFACYKLRKKEQRGEE